MNTSSFQTDSVISTELLSEFRSMTGFDLPDVLKIFYEECNGGRPEPNGIYISSEDDWVLVHAVYPLGGGGHSIGESYRIYSASDRNDLNMLPFAYDHGGERFCMDLKTGKIYLIEAEERANPTGPVLLAPDFESFLDSLQEPDDD